MGNLALPTSLMRFSTVRSMTSVPSRHFGCPLRRGGDGNCRGLPCGVLECPPKLGSEDIAFPWS
jgi:hypothetical protein